MRGSDITADILCQSDLVVDRIDLLLASRGNHFMVEIAELYQHGFRQLGVACRIALDECPSREVDPAVYPLIVAPHEFFAVYADPAFGADQRQHIASRAGMLNTEQPGSQWFDLTGSVARYARHVFDMNRSGVAAFNRLGVPATYTPIGFAPSLRSAAPECGHSKTIDIAFLGHAGPRRERFFARHRKLFQKYDCRLLFVPVDRPRGPGTPNYIFGQARNQLLRSTKVLINVHSSDRRYFEWHRALCAIANDCLLVTESSDETAPLVPGEHFVMAGLDALAQACEHYLNDQEARAVIVQRASRLLDDELSIEESCRQILGTLQTAGAARSRVTVVGRLAGYQARAGIAWRSVSRSLRHNRLTIPVHAAWRRLRLEYQQRFEVKPYEIRRRDIIRRLEAIQQSPGVDRSDYAIVENSPYQESAPPAVSVIVTLYNYARYVEGCLRSVADSNVNTLPAGVEVVVVDDASTDEGATVVQEYMNRCSQPVRLIRKTTNTGLADARNIGLRESRAEHIFILDADNLVYPQGLERLYRTIRERDLAAAYGLIATFDDRTGDGVGLLSCHGWDVEQLIRAPYIDAMALFRRADLLSVGGYTTELIRYGWFGWEDYDLWLKLASAGHECALCPEIVAAYRVHGASMIHVTNRYVSNFAEYFDRTFAKLVESVGPLDQAFGLARRARSSKS